MRIGYPARGVFIDLDSGRPLRFTRWGDPETGEYEAYAPDPTGTRPAEPRRLIRGKVRLRWVPAGPVFGRPSGPSFDPRRESPAERRDRLADEAQVARRLVVEPGVGCQVKGCGALAEYEVASERELTPEAGPDGELWERAATVAVRRFCARHFQSPTFVSLRGVESQVEVAVRPS